MVDPTQSQTTDRVPQADFFQGDLRSGLEKMRRRLLDLTRRNRLLNYRYSKKGSLRVVDELPDHLFLQLLDNKRLVFKPVPKPNTRRRVAPQGETADLFGTPTAADHAATLGIRTSFDLPTLEQLGEDLESRHVDKAIQTLHYADELEAVLRSLASTARLTIEETGTNMLYLAFGFLEWYESESSEQPSLAPLLMVPVTLQRGEPDPQTNAYRYTVEFSGEDILANISLQELLKKDFGLALPDFEPEESTVESYLETVKPILKRQPRWTIRRHITLSLFSFGKLLMYRDLDASTWPAGRGPESNDRIKEFFEGKESRGLDFAEDYALDALQLRQEIPELVDEADSSQHSALVDAVAGNSMVIAGPPGTGKSQTITNLIAAALTAGKKVLFVSEKLAALEVVRHRLERLGLGSFCLELHSHKSRKRALLDDVDRRIEHQRSFTEPSRLRDKLRALEVVKRELTDYVNLISRPYGALHQRLFDVFWAASRAEAAVPKAAQLLSKIQMAGAGGITLDQVAVMRQAIAQYANQLGALSKAGKASEHPWYGIRNPELTFQHKGDLCEAIESAKAGLEELCRELDELNALAGGRRRWLPERLAAFDAVAREIARVVPSPGIVDSLSCRLSEREIRSHVLKFLTGIKDLRQMREEVGSKYSIATTYPRPTLLRLRRELGEVAQHAPAVANVAELNKVGSLPAAAARALVEAEERIAAVYSFTEKFALSGELLPFARGVVTAIADCPVATLHLRHEGLLHADAVRVLENAEAESKRIKGELTRLGEHFDVDLAPSSTVLRPHTVATAGSGWWSFLRSDYRAARRFYLSISKTGPANGRVMHSRLRDLTAVIESRQRFEQNRDYKSVSGSFFQGVESPFHGLRLLARWYAKMEGALTAFGQPGIRTAANLWQAKGQVLASLTRAEASSDSCLARLDRAVSVLSDVRSAIGASVNQATKWSDIVEPFRTLTERLVATSQFCDSIGLPPSIEITHREELLGLLLGIDSLETRLRDDEIAKQVLQDAFAGPATDTARLEETVAYFDIVQSLAVPEVLRSWLCGPQVLERLDSLRTKVAQVQVTRSAALGSWRAFASLSQLNLLEWAGENLSIHELRLRPIIDRCQAALEKSAELPTWLDYVSAAGRLESLDLKYLVAYAESQDLDSGDLESAFEFVRARSVVDEAFNEHPELRRFSGLSHEEVRKRFAALDKECMELYRRKAAATIARRDVPTGVSYGPASAFTELSLLNREIAKQKRHIPLRQLILRAGDALQALKPCFMMGPLSVAQYLTPGAIEFDLLIVDEASQLRPQDALGAVARAQQIVIVGDQLQLPPTSFFERLGDDEEEDAAEATALEDSESILDVATALYRPARMLKWHYRSRHGSLIAFSNKEFYKNNLVVFPSPLPVSKSLGVKFIHVRDGVFEGRRNKIEARRIVTAALRHMEQRPDETLGIVAMNAPQRELIEEMFEQELKKHPAAGEFVRAAQESLEPVFVKNLENVQGDERDVIMISATYGKDANGNFHHRFGPILSHTGHRRLNVLFTRARKRVVLYSSMKSDEIRAQPSSAWGLRALKGYLAFAETGILETAQFTGRDPDSDFEVDVAESLKARGYSVAAQVGVAGYFLDLAVHHPDKSDAFVLGIECDGATYHASLSARDRDRLRQSVLESLGWDIHRIWSTDWFKQREKEVDRVVARIERIRQRPEAIHNEPEEGWEMPPSAPTGDDTDWVSEVEAEPLSDDEVREQLINLRNDIATFDPSILNNDSLLRAAMLTAIVATRPQSKSDWQRKVGVDLRLATSGEHVAAYLEKVLQITREKS